METFTVKFEIKSFYDDESFNLASDATYDLEAENLDSLFEYLDESDFILEIDDSMVINMETEESPIEVNIEYVLVTDSSGNTVYDDQ